MMNEQIEEGRNSPTLRKDEVSIISILASRFIYVSVPFLRFTFAVHMMLRVTAATATVMATREMTMIQLRHLLRQASTSYAMQKI